jgi:valyl-tRNA synthetase
LSNIEVIHKEANSKMYYLKYYLADGKNFLEIATSRIETIFSDVAVVVNPKDKRYSKLVGQYIIHPFSGAKLPIISDSYVDQDFGTGVMKVSAHAIEDIRIIQENNLEINECIDDAGFLNEQAKQFKGLERVEAREKIAQFLTEKKLIIKVEEYANKLALSERSESLIEILVKDQ